MSNDDLERLEPCPFCGSGDQLLVEHMEGTIIHPAYRVRCDNCGASSGYTDRDHVGAWNTRAESAQAAEPAFWFLTMGDEVSLFKSREDAEFYYESDHQPSPAPLYKELPARPAVTDKLVTALKLARDMMVANDLILPKTFEVIDEALEAALGGGDEQN